MALKSACAFFYYWKVTEKWASIQGHDQGYSLTDEYFKILPLLKEISLWVVANKVVSTVLPFFFTLMSTTSALDIICDTVFAGSYLATATASRLIIRDSLSMQVISNEVCRGNINVICWSPDSEFVAAACLSEPCIVYVFRYLTYTPLYNYN